MTDAEKKAYLDGYKRALKESLDDLAAIHRDYPGEITLRRLVDLVWSKFKTRIHAAKSGEFNFDGS